MWTCQHGFRFQDWCGECSGDVWGKATLKATETDRMEEDFSDDRYMGSDSDFSDHALGIDY